MSFHDTFIIDVTYVLGVDIYTASAKFLIYMLKFYPLLFMYDYSEFHEWLKMRRFPFPDIRISSGGT